MELKKLKKLVINLLIIIIVLSLVLYFSLKDNYQEIISYISNMKPIWFIIAILFLVLYRTSIGISSYEVVKINDEKVGLLKMIQINFIILFFHGITPFAGGGQPMEIYYLHNEKIKVEKCANIALQNFIVYQSALVIISIFAIIYNSIFELFPSSSLMRKLVMIGFAINFIILLLGFVLSFGKKINKFILNKGISIFSKLKIIKNKEKTTNNINEHISRFHENALLLIKQKNKFILLILLNIIAIYFNYLIAYAVCMGMGINLGFIQTIVMVTYVMMIGSFIPIPGGTGGIEYGYIYFFGYYIAGGALTASMLIWRFVGYYLAMIIGSFALILYRKKEKI